MKAKAKFVTKKPTNIHVCWYKVHSKEYCGAKADLCLFDKDDGMIPIKYYCDKHFYELTNKPQPQAYKQAVEPSGEKI